MVKCYNSYKVESLNAEPEKHYNHQTLCIPAEKRSVSAITSPIHLYLQEISNFCHYTVGTTAVTVVLPNTQTFFSIISLLMTA